MGSKRTIEMLRGALHKGCRVNKHALQAINTYHATGICANVSDGWQLGCMPQHNGQPPKGQACELTEGNDGGFGAGEGQSLVCPLPLPSAGAFLRLLLMVSLTTTAFGGALQSQMHMHFFS
jgi:hypothetical protein